MAFSAAMGGSFDLTAPQCTNANLNGGCTPLLLTNNQVQWAVA